MAEGARVRAAVPADAEAIASFQEAMAEATEGKRLDPRKVRDGVEAVLTDPVRGFYLIAEAEGRPVASLLVTREWSDWRNGFFWWIQSVFVEEEYRRRGVYRALHEDVRQRAREAGDVIGIRLYVERENAVAQVVYRMLGMQETYYRVYEEEL